MLLTALALSDDNLLAILHEPQVLQHVELSLHSCKVLAAQNITWVPAWHAVTDLHQVLTSLVPVGPCLMDPCSDQEVLHTWFNIGYCYSTLRGKLG
jgi:hypothetical protein